MKLILKFRKNLLTIISLLLINTSSIASEDLLLSGQIQAKETQKFTAPKISGWKVQIQWMLPEGEIAKKGDLVVVFDAGTLENSIEDEETKLTASKENLDTIKRDLAQKVLEAEYALKRTFLLLKQARIDAKIPKESISSYDYQKYQLALEKQVIVHNKAKEFLKQIKLAQKIAIEKQNLLIQRHTDTLQYYVVKLKKMTAYAERDGAVLYGTHPWSGEKLFVGATAQSSWVVAEIPSLKGVFIEAWVHEVDMPKLKLEQQASLNFDAYPKTTLTAVLKNIATQPETHSGWGNSGYYHTKWEFKNTADLKLLPGMSVRLTLKGSKNDPSL